MAEHLSVVDGILSEHCHDMMIMMIMILALNSMGRLKHQQNTNQLILDVYNIYLSIYLSITLCINTLLKCNM